MQDFFSVLTPSGVGTLIVSIIVTAVASGFTLYHVFKGWRERRQGQGVQWYRRPMIFLGIGLLILAIPSALNVIVSALTTHGYLPYSIGECSTLIMFVSIFLWLAIITYVVILRVRGRQ